MSDATVGITKNCIS